MPTRCILCRRTKDGAMQFCGRRCGIAFHERCVEKAVLFRETGYCRGCRPGSLRNGSERSPVVSAQGHELDLLARMEWLEMKLDAALAGSVPSRNDAKTKELSKNPPAYDTVVRSGGSPNFPPKVWIKIFEKLNAAELVNARLVCRRWNQIIGHCSSLVDKLQLTFSRGTKLDPYCDPVVTLKSPISLRHTRAAFRELTFVGAATWWQSIGQNLHTLTLIDCKISIDMLLEMLKTSPALKRLSLSFGEHLFFRTLPEVTFTLQHLEHLALANFRRVEILDIFKHLCPLLKTLKLPGENKHDEFAVAAFRLIWTVQNTLEELELTSEPTELWDRLTDAVGMQLRRVKVATGTIDETRLVRLSETFPTIEGLMTTTSRVADKVLSAIGANLCKLNYLDITLSTSESPDDLSFLRSMPELRTLVLKCDFPSVGFGNLRHPNLESLTLRGVEQRSGHWFDNFPNLRSIALADCTVASWFDLFDPIVKLKRLAHLSLVGIKVENAGNEYLPDYLGRLTTLLLVGCDLSKDSLIMLFTQCPRLARIFLKGVASFDDEVTLAICQHVRELKEIQVSSCPGLTDLFLEHLWNYYDEQLERVKVVDCANISSEALEQLLE